MLFTEMALLQALLQVPALQWRRLPRLPSALPPAASGPHSPPVWMGKRGRNCDRLFSDSWFLRVMSPQLEHRLGRLHGRHPLH